MIDPTPYVPLLSFHRDAPPGDVRLGKQEPRHNPAVPYLAEFLGTALPAPPPALGYTQRIASWPMMGNDRCGDCGLAGLGHAIQQWTTYAGVPFVPPDAAILAAYTALSNYNPITGAHDDGVVLDDAITYARTRGIGGHTIAGSATIEAGSILHAKQSVEIFGSTYLGFALPRSVQGQSMWVVPTGGARGDGRPGSWGGHCVLMVAYDPHWLWVVSWGQLIAVSWAFFAAYNDEAHALLSQDWVVTATRRAPSNFDWAGLQLALPAVAH